jgi:hypothetical protein
MPAGSIGASPEMLAQYGVAPTDLVKYGFDIIIDVVPAQGPVVVPPSRPPDQKDDNP